MNILDHGYCILVDTWGSDEDIIRAARMSTNKGFAGWPADEKLLRYLWEHKHTSPFEMGGLIVEVQAPIFIFREWQRHRTQSYNEMSARYTPLPELYYVPSLERLMNGKQSQKNKQGSQEGFSYTQARAIQGDIVYASEQARIMYRQLLDAGVANELARLVMPVNWYSRMRASANLKNWLDFLRLRTHPSAQWEIREYANEVARLVSERFPRVYALFEEEHGQKG